jgi:transcriptional regulator with XRE-family HTH domain
MMHKTAANYLKAHRRRSGLTQRELGELLGYRDPGQVSRHERSMSLPALTTALAYEVIFRVPVAVLFVGLHGSTKENIESKMRQLEAKLQGRTTLGRDANLVAQKLMWLNGRRNLK